VTTHAYFKFSWAEQRLEGIADPIFKCMTCSNDKNRLVIFDLINNKMSFKRVNPNRWRDFVAFSRDSWSARN